MGYHGISWDISIYDHHLDSFPLLGTRTHHFDEQGLTRGLGMFSEPRLRLHCCLTRPHQRCPAPEAAAAEWSASKSHKRTSSVK